MAAFQDGVLESLNLDSTVIRAASGGRIESHWNVPGEWDEQTHGRSRGGFGTKIHAAASGLGFPTRLNLTPFRAADAPQADARIDVPPTVAVGAIQSR